MDHYGISDNELSIFKSYFSNRKQFVMLDYFSSDSPNCSCVQGSKLSGTLYNLYTNEIPLLHQLMDTNWFTVITQSERVNYYSVHHITVNFVDDSTNIINSDKIVERQYSIVALSLHDIYRNWGFYLW